jgi:C4-dicarboxylate-specific signal transduction histidine kinase
LVAANRAKVYAQVSRWLIHDLRNPTQALTLLPELMTGNSEMDPEGLSGSVVEAASHLTHSLELLDRALRPVSWDVVPGPVSLQDILRFLESLHRVHRSSVPLDLGATNAVPLPAVIGVEAHLEHALLNLVVNAIDAFADRPRGRISVGAELDGSRVTLYVTDDGPGVAQEIRERLFEPFVTTKREEAVAGLGLAVARQLLRWHGGNVRYLPDDGPGARFAADFAVWH